MRVPTSLPGKRWPVAFLLLLTPVVVGLATLIVGQSVNWDLLNYHLYNPHAFWTGRWQVDVAPAQLQSFHNPLLHLPYYLAYQWLDLRLLAALLGLVQGLLIFPLYRLARGLVGHRLSRRGTFYICILGLMGPMFMSELGTVFGDSLLAIVLVMALALVIRSRGEMRRFLIAGLLAGAATGLKLTVAVYLPGLLLATWLIEQPRRPWKASVLLLIGLFFGVLLTAGWWMLELQQRFGSPLFPLLNGWFGSEWAPNYSHRDLRFLPDGFWSGVFKPLLAAVDYSSVLELKFRGPRVLTLFLTLLAVPWVAMRIPLPRKTVALSVFCAATFLVWSFTFGHYRYLTGVEILAPVALAAIWYYWGKDLPRSVNVIPLLLVATQLAVKVPSWGRDEYGSLKLPMEVPDDAALVIAGSAPVGWLALQLQDDTPMIRIAGNFWELGDGTRMTGLALERLQAHSGPLMTVAMEEELGRVTEQMRAADLYLNRLQCVPLQERPFPSLSSAFWQCPVTRFNLGVTRPPGS
jgi:hypothetical protein